MADILAMGGAHANSMFVAAADRIGIERGQPFLGNRLICATPAGRWRGRCERGSRGDAEIRCCATGVPTSTTRCSAPTSSAAGT